jgi:hypothetical protein
MCEAGNAVCACRSELLARPLALWNHLDIDFSEEAHCHAAPLRAVPSLPADGVAPPQPAHGSSGMVCSPTPPCVQLQIVKH